MNAFEEEEFEGSELDFQTWKKIFKYLMIYKSDFIKAITGIVLVAVVDIIFPILNKIVIDDYIVPGNKEALPMFAVYYMCVVVAMSVLIFIFIHHAGKIQVNLSYKIRQDAFERIQTLSFSYFDKTPVGWIISRVTSDSNKLGEVLSWSLIDLLWGGLMMIGIAIVLFFYNVKLALITLSVVPFLVVIAIYFRNEILKAYRFVRKINSKITGAFNEGIVGAKTTKTLVLEEKHYGEFSNLSEDMYKYSTRAAIKSAVFTPIVIFTGNIGVSLAIYFGGNYNLDGALTYGTLVLFIAYMRQFFDPVMQISRILAEFQQAQASAERVVSLIDSEQEITDSDDVIKKYGDELNHKTENWEKLVGDIIFDNVSFSYIEGEKILTDFNLHVSAGQTIALVGETGAGKSTIVNLICRFYEPTEGKILIDNVDYKERSLGWLHANLGYVLQSPHLFSGTIMENIRYGRLSATDEEVMKAAKVVNAHKFINELEDGYNTEVGEGGGRLSTGQKQLISFARAILADPSILILDEATSSIDTETEQLIQSAIDKLLVGRTSFIIAHRLSTIVNADRILVLRKGIVTESGTHEELLDLGGYYYNLYTNQFAEEQTQETLK